MIEIYVGLTLMGLGYILNQNRPIKSNPIKQLNVNEMPSTTNVYDSNYVNTVKKVEASLAQKKFADASKSSADAKVPPRVVSSQLSGMSIPENEFKHNNMIPFYRGKLKHIKVDEGMQQLEAFTGAQQFYKPKKEVEIFFKPQPNIGNVTGTPATANYVQTRMEAPRVRNNTLPFEQIRVGPAINRGYTAEPTGGFQQYDTRDYVMPKTADQLRVVSKPKSSYEGRVIEGQKGSKLGMIGKIEKNRVPTSFTNTPANYFRTTGAYFKEKQQPDVNAKYTSRQDVSTKEYAGGAYKTTVGDTKRGNVREPFKEQLASFGMTNPSLTHMPNQRKDDYGKASIHIYDNERSVTTTKTYQGNLASIFKSLTAPIEDLIKVTRKEYTVEAPREYGNLQKTCPAKQTVHDPNLVTRTTIKETTIHESDILNLKGATKLMVYDPNQVTRTTIKETTIHDSDLLNLKGAAKLTVHDPNQVTRTTVKETLLHDAQPVNIKGDGRRGQVFDPNVKAKTTVRQTVDPISTQRNMGPNFKMHTAVDPNDLARTTVKETVDVNAHRSYGNVDRGENFQGGYDQENYDAPETQRHIIAKDSDYHGNPNRQAGDAYAVLDDVYVPSETQKQAITDNSEYYGGAGDKTSHKPMSYEDAYNATFDELRQELLMEREPTQTSVKVFNGADDVVMSTRKVDCDIDAPRNLNNYDHIVNVPLDAAKSVNLTKDRNAYDVDDRLDIDILEAFKNNEFTQPLDSVA